MNTPNTDKNKIIGYHTNNGFNFDEALKRIQFNGFISQNEENEEIVVLKFPEDSDDLHAVIRVLSKVWDEKKYTVVVKDNFSLNRLDNLTSEYEYDTEKIEFNDWRFENSFDIELTPDYIQKYISVKKEASETSSFRLIQVHFSKCSFCHFRIGYDQIKIRYKFYDCDFQSINLNNIRFEENLYLHKCRFDQKVKFSNTSFLSLVDFFKSTFKENVIFYKVDFIDRAIFSKVNFSKVVFLYCKAKSDSYISFEFTTITEVLDVSRANFNCNLQFWGLSITEPYFAFKMLNAETDTLRDLGIPTDAENVRQSIRETYRIVKQSFLNNGNFLESERFRKFEITTKKNELKAKQWHHRDSLILHINEITNDHGTNWVNALVWFLITSYFCWSVLILTDIIEIAFNLKGILVETNKISLVPNFRSYLDLLILTKWEGIQPWRMGDLGIISSFWLFISRVILGFLTYQIIISFRRFGKV